MFRKLAYSILAFVLAATPAYADAIITGAIPSTFTPGSVISSSQMNANFQYLISQVNANAAKNGANSSITSLSALTTPLAPAQGGSSIFVGGTATGTASAMVVASAIPNGFTLTSGNSVLFTASASNTGAVTLAVNGTLATNVYRQTPSGLQALTGGEIIAGQVVAAFYDGVQYELFNSSAQVGGYGQLTNFLGSATPDLGTIASHNINLTGGPFTITSFGSSANATYPIYLVRFNAANTLTHSATLNLLNSTNRLTAPSDQGIYFYNGTGTWFELAYFPNVVKSAPTQANALTIKNNAVTPSTQIDITATEMVMDTAGGGNYYTENYGSCTVNLSVVGAGGIDAGVIAINTWYYVYGIGNGTAVSCLASTSATAPTLPAGYAYKARLGAMRTDGASALYRTLQKGARARFVITAATNTATFPFANASATGVWAAWTVQGAGAPTTAKEADFVIAKMNTGFLYLAPNNAYSVAGGGANPSPVGGSVTGANVETETMSTLVLESAAVYIDSNNASNSVQLIGWTDQVNAN